MLRDQEKMLQNKPLFKTVVFYRFITVIALYVSPLQELKKKWDEVHGVYQKLPLIIDTLAMKTRKIELEEELSQLQKDIQLFERFKIICVAKD